MGEKSMNLSRVCWKSFSWGQGVGCETSTVSLSNRRTAERRQEFQALLPSFFCTNYVL